MMETFRVRKTVEFAETDAAGFLHFSNYLRYVEIAERAFFEKLALPLISDSADQLAGFPRVHAQCDYRAPLHFGDTVEIVLWLDEVGTRSLHFGFRLEIPGDPSPRCAAEGTMVTVYSVRDRAAKTVESRALPAHYLQKLRPAIRATPPPAKPSITGN